MHTNTIIWQWCTVCAQNSFDLIYRLLWTPKSATILDHKPRQRKTGATNQKHLSCERFFFLFQDFFFWGEGGCLLKCDGHPPPPKKSTHRTTFFFFLFQPNWGVNLFIVMETIRENLPTRDHIKNPNHIRETGETARGEEGEARRETGETDEGEETGRMANAQPHQTERPISERWMREAADCNSFPQALQISPSHFAPLVFCFFGCFFKPFIHFLAFKFSFSHFSLSLTLLSASPPSVSSFDCLLFFPPMSHFTFVPPHSSSFSLSTFHLFPACASLCKTPISKKWSAKSFFYSVLPSFTCKNNCNNNLSNSIIKCFLSVPALPPPPLLPL